VGTDFFGDVFVDELVVGGGVTAHEVRGGPVFLAVFLIKREPGEVFEFLALSFMRQAMSTPTAYGTTALSVASTPPIGRP